MSIQRINNMSSRIAVNLQAKKLSLKSKQKGASALEYLVLAAAIVLIIGLALGSGLGDQVTAAFADLFSDAASGGATP
ncbi:MAG: Flp family type IVb pilin [Marinobacter sp.]|nr:Flp family type IVb pilin [Marinobacter sp.]